MQDSFFFKLFHDLYLTLLACKLGTEQQSVSVIFRWIFRQSTQSNRPENIKQSSLLRLFDKLPDKISRQKTKREKYCSLYEMFWWKDLRNIY